MINGKSVAAIDMGSNSFRLLLGKIIHNEFVQTEYIKETVRQGNLDEDGNIRPEAFQLGLDCLARFKERLSSQSFDYIRAVATHTLREATNRKAFVAEAEQLMGFPIEVISGQEEARLVFSGVTHLLPPNKSPRMAIDIGGRSTEIVVGTGFEASLMYSYPVGSVGMTQAYFADGAISKKILKNAVIGIISRLDHAEKTFANYTADHIEVWGCSGTLGAVYSLLEANTDNPDSLRYNGIRCISLADVQKLEAKLLTFEHVSDIKIDGLKSDRQPVIMGGFAIVAALFELLKLERICISEGALRHGVIYDLIEQTNTTTNRRDDAIHFLAKRFNANPNQGDIVQETALHLWNQVASTASLNCNKKRLNHATTLLAWAADLHEIGAHISPIDQHKHGAYIIENTQLVGFYEQELAHLSVLVLASRGKLSKLKDTINSEQPILALQVLCLRLAVALCHARRLPDLTAVSLQQNAKGYNIAYNAQWADEHPQSFYLLSDEASAWAKLDIDVDVATLGSITP